MAFVVRSFVGNFISVAEDFDWLTCFDFTLQQIHVQNGRVCYFQFLHFTHPRQKENCMYLMFVNIAVEWSLYVSYSERCERLQYATL